MEYIITALVSLIVGAVLATLYHTQIANVEAKATAAAKTDLATILALFHKSTPAAPVPPASTTPPAP